MKKIINKNSPFYIIDLLFIYIIIVLSLTVIFRNQFDGEHIKLELFWSYKVLTTQFWQIFDNIIMFIPFGFLGGIITRKYRYTLIASLIFSVIIELLQWILKIGLCEIDDVINNIFGCSIGIVILIIIRKKLIR